MVNPGFESWMKILVVLIRLQHIEKGFYWLTIIKNIRPHLLRWSRISLWFITC